MNYPPIKMEDVKNLPEEFSGYNILCCQKKHKLVNCSPGPTQLPHAVLDNLKKDMFIPEAEFSYGITPLEMSHRCPEFSEILKNVNKKLRSFMKIPDDFTILWTRGGGHGQFAAVPLNLKNLENVNGKYIVTGSWSSRAYNEAKKFINTTCTQKHHDKIPLQFTDIPDTIEINDKDTYVYLCSNETINGTEFREDGVPYPSREENSTALLIVDMSSDFGMKVIPWEKLDVAFACTSKNFGVAGANITIVRKSVLERIKDQNSVENNIPSVLDWNLYDSTESLYNTPAIFNIYLIEKVLDHYIQLGGIESIEYQSKEKARLIYNVLENCSIYSPLISDPKIQSNINIPFLVGNGEDVIRSKFLAYCYQQNIVGLRTKTPFQYSDFNMTEPLRISLYNGISIEDTLHICNTMITFENMIINDNCKKTKP
mgnify:CR=1 FL=1